jgi:hypothetical protein
MARMRIPRWLSPRFRRIAREIAVPEYSSDFLSSHLAKNIWRRLTSARLARVMGQHQELSLDRGTAYRFPFLDKELVMFTLTIPYAHWPAPRPFARFHREALADLLPPEISRRFTKADFGPARALRVRKAAPLIHDILERGPWYSEEYVDRHEAQRLCRAVLWNTAAITPSDWQALWSISTLEAWMRRISGYHPQQEGGPRDGAT